MKRVGIILQARMGSTRLPGKVLRELAGRPMIEWSIDALTSVIGVEEVILATSDRPEDGVLSTVAEKKGIRFFRGSELDVLDRFYRCAQAFSLDVIVRATGDNPLVDPQEVENLLDFFSQRNLAYATAFPDYGSGLPVGVGTEVFTFAALEEAWRDGRAPHHREHVNELFQENPARFPQATYVAPAEKHAPQLRLTVDTPEDFARVEKRICERRRKFTFVTDGNHQLGMGHVFRTLNLAREIRRESPEAEFSFALPEGSPARPILEKAIAARFSVRPEILASDVLIVDELSQSPVWLETLKKSTGHLVLFDDTGAGHWHSHLAVNGLYECLTPRTAESQTESLAGPDYLVLNPRVRALRRQRAETPAHPERRIFLSQGGADTYGVVPQIVSALAAWFGADKRRELHIHVGPAFSHRAELETALANFPGKAKVQAEISDLLGLAAQMDTAICAGGMMAFELVAMGLPVIGVTQEKKEIESLNYLGNAGAILNLGEFKDGAIREMIRALDGNSIPTSDVIDGRGASRVARRLVALASG